MDVSRAVFGNGSRTKAGLGGLGRCKRRNRNAPGTRDMLEPVLSKHGLKLGSVPLSSLPVSSFRKTAFSSPTTEPLFHPLIRRGSRATLQLNHTLSMEKLQLLTMKLRCMNDMRFSDENPQ